MKTIYDLTRNAVTTLVSITVASWVATHGDASIGCRVVGTVGMFIFLKWLTLDTWDYVRYLIRGRR